MIRRRSVLAGLLASVGMGAAKSQSLAVRAAIFQRRSSAASVGGVAIGAAGTGYYTGFTLIDGDEFTSLNIVGPGVPAGKYFPMKPYSGPRGNDTTLPMEDVDPLTTGYRDGNRGVAVGFDTMGITSGTRLKLQARRATAPEQARLSPYGAGQRLELGSAINTLGNMIFYPGTAGKIRLEARMRFTPKAGNPVGWHPAFWTYAHSPSSNPPDGDEWDILEGSSQRITMNYNAHTGGSVSGASFGTTLDHFDGTDRTYSADFKKSTDLTVAVDGSVVATKAGTDPNSKNKASWMMLSSHILNASYDGETYSASAWAADADGAAMEVDWWRVWAQPGITRYVPLATVPSLNVAYTGTGTIVLPAAATLWGKTPDGENVQCFVTEEWDTGGAHLANIDQFPSGVTYNAGTRTITVDFSALSGNPGRLHVIVTACDTVGSICQPARAVINRGPKVNVPNLTYGAGEAVSYDVYAACDCGSLVSDAYGAKAKTITVTGLSGSGLSYSDATGLLTGTATLFSGTITVTVTNNAGQSASATPTLTVNAVAGYTTWTGPGWFDASDASKMTLSGTDVTAMTNKRSGGGNLTVGGTGANIDRITAGQNGLNIVRVVRDTASPPRLVASTTSALSQLFQGSDQPFLVIVVYKPTDTNTGFIFSASASLSPSLSENVSLVRRNATASAARKNASGESGEVTFGSGQASGAWRVVAIKHSGTAVSIWDTSTTKAVNAAADDRAAISTAAQFMLFASWTTNGAYAPTQCNMDFAEIVIEASRSDADIQQAITDLASKWAITLS